MLSELQSAKIIERLLEAVTSEDVQAVLRDQEYAYFFDDPQVWKNYGNREKNWDTVGNQQGNAVGALLENVVNGIDSVLLRAAEESGLKDNRSPIAPQSMTEAVERFFEVPGGRLSNLSEKQRYELAERCVSMSIKRGRKNGIYPTYTVVDHGTGQHPQDFAKTFLSLSEKNKEGIKFVQGKFNMGSTGVLRFCTRCEIALGHHKLILSKHYKSDRWGWTIIRVRPPRGQEGLPVAEYFFPSKISTFRVKEIYPFQNSKFKSITEGTVVKLFEVDIGAPHHNVDFGIYNAISTSLITTPLPIRTYDMDAAPVKGKGDERAQGIASRTFAGLYGVLKVDEASEKEGSKSLFHYQVREINSATLGKVTISATGLTQMEEALQKQSGRLFFTINGQKHASLTSSWLNNACQLGDIVNNLFVNVDCTEMDATAMTQIFMPDRERMVENSFSTELREKVKEALKEDFRLHSFASQIRLRRAQDSLKDNEEAKKLLREMARTDPAIKNLFGFGEEIKSETTKPGSEIKFVGKKFPTFMEPLNLRPEGEKLVKDIPINTHRRIECTTDARNDYLSRAKSPGAWWCSAAPGMVEFTASLHNGHASFTVNPPANAVPGQELDVEFGFKDESREEPLRFAVCLRIVEAEAVKKNEKGVKRDVRPDEQPETRMPEIIPVKQDQWISHNFNDLSAGYVSKSDEGATVYINVDHRALVDMRIRVRDDAKRILNENIFKTGLGIFALALHREGEQKIASGQESFDIDTFVRSATQSVAPYFIPIVTGLGNIA